jgi:hypothetical protein
MSTIEFIFIEDKNKFDFKVFHSMSHSICDDDV